ncbi:MAG TPA: aminotransferase [Gammaproteobacteria bacterium]|nr:aminotransferase [Gammaproteobacteria bacterium]
MPLSPAALAAEFPLQPGLCYLNHAGVAPWPRRAALAVEAFARENTTLAASSYPRWLAVEQRLREQLARLINAASPMQVGLLKNTSEGLSFVAAGLSWRAGQNVVIAREEFPSNRIVWEALGRHGVAVRQVPVLDAADPEADLLAACDADTRLLSISACQYINGMKMSLDRLGDYCRRRDILFVVDAIQAIGAVPFDVEACQCDVAVADGHKWLLGPEGLALFYVSDRALERLAVSEYGWHMVARVGDYERSEWGLSPDVRRFECGSPNLLGTHALEASIGLLIEHGESFVFNQLRCNVEFLSSSVEQIPGAESLSPSSPDRRSGILTVAFAGTDPGRLDRRLRQAGVFAAVRGGGIRLSPHFYTPQAMLEEAARVLARCVVAERRGEAL